MFFDQTFTIIHNNGNVEFVEDLYQYANQYNPQRFYLHIQFHMTVERERELHYYGPSYGFCNSDGFFLYSCNGKMISPDFFLTEYLTVREKYWKNGWGTRRSKPARHTTRRYKRPSTQSARKAACGVVKEDGEPEFRGARKHSQLRTYWDDMNVRSSCGWKTSTKRKHQYKGS